MLIAGLAGWQWGGSQAAHFNYDQRVGQHMQGREQATKGTGLWSSSSHKKTNMRISMFTPCPPNININLPRIKDAKHLRTTPMSSKQTQQTPTQRDDHHDDHDDAHWCRRWSRRKRAQSRRRRQCLEWAEATAVQSSLCWAAISVSELGFGSGSHTVEASELQQLRCRQDSRACEHRSLK